MPNTEKNKSLRKLIETYFSDSNCWIWLKAGDVLMEKGQYNSRLFLVQNGKLRGVVEHEDGSKEEILTVEKNNFLGVYSFFSQTYSSIATIEAVTDCELTYIDRHARGITAGAEECFEKEFMPVVVTDLMERQKRLLELSIEKQQTLKRLHENQNLATLGQMAAGTAHELNNSVTVLARNSNWLVEQINERWSDPIESALFESGLLKGRFLSSKEVRENKKQLINKYQLSEDTASLLAQTGLSDELMLPLAEKDFGKVKTVHNAWEMGAALHDMILASEQSTHVVRSIKMLGAQHKLRQTGMNINDSLKNTLALLRHKLRQVKVNLNLRPLPGINGNSGEFVQVWTNLIKNSCEAMQSLSGRSSEISIESTVQNNRIIVKIKDNGPGVPSEIIPEIFQPNVTTKVDGLSFGLGLGLTIVKRIINEYNGRIEVQSSKNGTSFIIYIPVGGNDE